jgi:Fe(3+) dicitrate transport protein
LSQANQTNNTYGSVKGNVADANTDELLVGVNIYVPNNNVGAASDKHGSFEIIKLLPGRYNIVASMIGYNTAEKEVVINGGDVVELNFMLKKRFVDAGSGMIDTLTSAYDFPQINVIGKRPSLLNSIPGSANVISSTSIKSTKPITGNEIFKKVTGLNVVDEEGAGLRANIGIRGLDPDRSIRSSNYRRSG